MDEKKAMAGPQAPTYNGLSLVNQSKYNFLLSITIDLCVNKIRILKGKIKCSMIIDKVFYSFNVFFGLHVGSEFLNVWSRHIKESDSQALEIKDISRTEKSVYFFKCHLSVLLV